MKSTAVKQRPAAAAGAAAQSFVEAFERLLSLRDSGATELVLVRHAEPDYRAAAKTREPWDPPLSEKGRFQALRAAVRLRQMKVDAVFTSTMRRALETAAFIAAFRDLPMLRIQQLREIDFDPAELGPAPDRQKLAAELAIRFVNRPRWDSLPGFEPSHQFRQRVMQAINGIIAHHPGQRVAVVTHGGVINAYLGTLLEIPRDMFFLPEHASLTVVRSLRDQSCIQRINDFAHLLPVLQP